MDRDEQRGELVRTVMQLAHNLGKRVIAEGVETIGERERLREMGCDLLQGFLFSRPAPPEAISVMLDGEQAANTTPRRERSEAGPSAIPLRLAVGGLKEAAGAGIQLRS